MTPHVGTVALGSRVQARTRVTRNAGAVRYPRTARCGPHAGVILDALPTFPLVGTSEHTHADPAALHEPTVEEIRRLAYAIYLVRGREPGHDVEDWLWAERELRARPRA